MRERRCDRHCHHGNMNPIHLYFSIIYRHGRIMHDRSMKQFGLTGQQMGYLRYINENPGVSQEDLVKLLQIDKGAVSKSIKDMVEKGYVYREKNPRDKRTYCLFPTEKACLIARRGKVCSARFEEKITEGLTDEEKETFEVLLGKVTDNIVKMLGGGEI